MSSNPPLTEVYLTGADEDIASEELAIPPFSVSDLHATSLMSYWHALMFTHTDLKVAESR